MKFYHHFFAALFIAGLTSQAVEAAITLRLAENQPEDNPVTVAMRHFAELVARKTKGQVTIEVYASGQLGQEPETIEQVQAGVIDFARVNSVVMANVSPSMGVFTLPYIFRDTHHKYTILDGPIGSEIQNDLSKAGLVGFGYMEAGTRHFYTRTTIPIHTLADLKGLKIRVQPAPISTRMVALLGASPTPMNYGEVYSALQTGIIDGAENDYVSFLTSSHHEVARNVIEDGHLSPPALLVMNRSRFMGLSPEIQTVLQEAAKEAVMLERAAMIKANDLAKATVIAAGVRVVETDTSPFRNAVQPIYEEFPQLSDIIARIKATP